jgi:type II secretion system protein J
MRTIGNPDTRSAFTLMEVMLALAVSAIVLAGIGGVFYSALRLRERTVTMLDQAMPMHQALTVLRRDLRGAVPPTGTYGLAGDFKIEPLGGGLVQSFRLQCFTSSGVISDNDNAIGADVQEVIYELRDPISGGVNSGKDLVRSINRNPLGTAGLNPDEQRLLGHVESLEFAGYDGANWREMWDTSLSDTNLPSALRVRIQMSGESNMDGRNRQPYEMVVPVVSVSRTNQTQTTTSTGGGA